MSTEGKPKIKGERVEPVWFTLTELVHLEALLEKDLYEKTPTRAANPYDAGVAAIFLNVLKRIEVTKRIIVS